MSARCKISLCTEHFFVQSNIGIPHFIAEIFSPLDCCDLYFFLRVRAKGSLLALDTHNLKGLNYPEVDLWLRHTNSHRLLKADRYIAI